MQSWQKVRTKGERKVEGYLVRRKGGAAGVSARVLDPSPDNDCANLVQISRVREKQQRAQQHQEQEQQGQLMPADMQKRVNE